MDALVNRRGGEAADRLACGADNACFRPPELGSRRDDGRERRGCSVWGVVQVWLVLCSRLKETRRDWRLRRTRWLDGLALRMLVMVLVASGEVGDGVFCIGAVGTAAGEGSATAVVDVVVAVGVVVLLMVLELGGLALTDLEAEKGAVRSAAANTEVEVVGGGGVEAGSIVIATGVSLPREPVLSLAIALAPLLGKAAAAPLLVLNPRLERKGCASRAKNWAASTATWLSWL